MVPNNSKKESIVLRNYILVMTTLFVLVFSGCGGGGNDGNSDSPDIVKPVITLRGAETVTLVQGTAYTELGATATDDRDANVAVVTSGSVDVNTLGSYTITYTAKDIAGNKALAIRIINIIPDSIKNFIITIQSTKKIAAYEYILEITDNLSEFPNVEINSTFLSKFGREVKDLEYQISEREVRFGAYTTGDADGVSGKYTIGTFSTDLNSSNIIIKYQQCVDSNATVIDCSIKTIEEGI